MSFNVHLFAVVKAYSLCRIWEKLGQCLISHIPIKGQATFCVKHVYDDAQFAHIRSIHALTN